METSKDIEFDNSKKDPLPHTVTPGSDNEAVNGSPDFNPRLTATITGVVT